MKRIFSILLAIGLLAAALLPQGPSFAADAVVGTGSPASCTESAFNTALGAVQGSGGGIVTFSCGGSPHTIPITGYKSISSQVTIDGGGLITLDGVNSAPFFQVFFNASLTLKNLTLIRGWYNGVAPLENLGTLTLDGVTVTQHNTASSALVNSGTLTILNSTFANNTVQLGPTTNGGALRSSSGSVMIQNSLFSGNHATTMGGALYHEGGQLTIYQSEFVGNTSQMGGALLITNTPAVFVVESTLRQNVAQSGGAIDIRSSSLALNRSRLDANQATSTSGGGVWIFNSSVNLDQSEIAGNTAKIHGGGLYCFSGSITAAGSTFTLNAADNQGGGIFSLCQIQGANLTFSANRAITSGGGAIYKSGSTNTTLIHTTIAFNQAGTFGGGIYNNGATTGVMTISRSVLAGNSTGNCDGVITSGGYNLADNTTCSAFTQPGDQQNAALHLAPLGSYGGRTPTHYIEAASAARNNIPLAQCVLEADQRGIERPQEGACDSGAVEYTPRALYLPLAVRAP